MPIPKPKNSNIKISDFLFCPYVNLTFLADLRKAQIFCPGVLSGVLYIIGTENDLIKADVIYTIREPLFLQK